MVLVKSYMHKWGKQGVKGGEHLGWRTNNENNNNNNPGVG
jgi:hypothetical protein